MPERVLITGATGFVAPHLVAALRRRSPNVSIIGTASQDPAPGSSDLAEWHAADLRAPEAVRALLETTRPTAVIHLAGRRDGPLRELLEVNVAATEHLLATARAVLGPSVPVVVVGSAAELGWCRPEELPLAEDAPCRPIDAYGVSKLAQAAVAQAAALRHGQRVVRVRLFNLIGPNTPAGLLPGRAAELVRAALREGSARPLAFRDLGTQRDYVDVRDAAVALALAVERGRPGELYHVGRGQAVEGRRVVEALIREACPREPRLAYEETVAGPPTVPIQIADASRAGHDLGWSPETPFERSVRDLWRAAAALA